MKKLEKEYEIRLKQMILNNHYLLNLLRHLSKIYENAYLSAGVIRNWIWSIHHHQDYTFEGTEIDVIFYDVDEKNTEISNAIINQIIQDYPHHIWDVTNQATVYHWYKKENGDYIEPLTSIDHALSLWPETATAVAIRLLENNDLEIIAPFGLEDLFELKLRWNDALVSREVFLERITTKQFLKRWNKLKLIS